MTQDTIALPNQYTNPSDMPRSLVHKPVSKAWKSRINQKMWWAQGFEDLDSLTPENKKLALKNRTLIAKILAFGGEEVCMPYIEEDYASIMKRGVFMYGDDVELKKGLPSQCHFNSARLWDADSSNLSLMTGYALSDDGMWRQHSWCIHQESGKIIETTELRIAYFGFVMTPDESEAFNFDNS
tara:strand:+ start:3056 stop:3604 length:549 start_codon:yes stop_codon:yes gene_type:complete